MSRNLEGRLAPPLTNGELAFDEPWQGRVFGMAHRLCEAGAFEWREFQTALIGVLDRAHRGGTDGADHYYEHFLAALEALLAAKGIVTSAVLDQRAVALSARPHGHDH